jgi:16S rRNA G966 N2-methylase RsmD
MDNSDIRQKILVRQKGLQLLPNPKIIIDMYAGEGNISRCLWSKLNADLTCIEKDESKIKKIDFAKTICDDNLNHIDITINADIVDMDAYRLVMNPLKTVLNASNKTKLIFFTESSPFSKHIYSTIEEILKLDITSFWIEKCNSSNVFYGFIYKKL